MRRVEQRAGRGFERNSRHPDASTAPAPGKESLAEGKTQVSGTRTVYTLTHIKTIVFLLASRPLQEAQALHAEFSLDLTRIGLWLWIVVTRQKPRVGILLKISATPSTDRRHVITAGAFFERRRLQPRPFPERGPAHLESCRQIGEGPRPLRMVHGSIASAVIPAKASLACSRETCVQPHVPHCSDVG
jgi:hypothetical protein